MRYSLYFFIGASVLATQVQAGTMAAWSWVGTISAGPVWENAAKTQTFFLAPEIEKTYAASKSSHTLASGELFLGLQRPLSHTWLAQLGLAGATSGNARLQGEIWDDADPEFNNYIYGYKVRQNRVAVKGKLLLDKDCWFLPWVSASIGIGFNEAKDFTDTPLIFEAVEEPSFSSNTTSAFTYTLGVGLQKALSSQLQVGLGYEFADWGKSKLGRAFGQTLNTGLRLNHLYTNGVLLNLTYLV